MEKDLDLNVIKATQSSLGKYIKRPPLSEKLLRKPPFRFLHDIITNIIKSTGFFEGLFDENELVSDNVKDRDSKVAFLNKVISVLGLTTGKSLAAKPSKIVSGQDPEKTNELLQCIAEALDNKLSTVEAVKKYKNKDPVQKTENLEKSKDYPEPISKTAEKKNDLKNNEKVTKLKRERTERSITRNEKDKTKDVKAKPKPEIKPKDEIKKPASKKPPLQKETKKSKKVHDVIPVIETKVEDVQPNKSIELEIEKSNEEIPLNGNVESEIEPDESLQEINKEIEKVDEEKQHENQSQNANVIYNEEPDIPNTLEKEDSKPTTVENLPVENEQKSAEKVSEVTKDIINEKPIEIKARPQSVRPPSSRPGAPRLKERNDENFTDLLVGKVNIIVESTPNDEDEETSLVVIDDQPTNSTSNNSPIQSASNQHGHLVQQILDAQKEFSQIATGKTEIEWEFDSQKAKEASTQEIEQLRFNIEALSRIANPLGKLLDHIQEDVEVMRQELQQWTEQYLQASKELAKQKTANEESLSPLMSKIKQLNADIEEKRDKINDLKIIIHRKSTRINDLLSSGDVQ